MQGDGTLLVEQDVAGILGVPMHEQQALGMLALISLIWGASAPGFRWIFEMEHAPGALLVACLANLVAFFAMLLQYAFDDGAKKFLSGSSGLRGGVETGVLFYAGDLLLLVALTYTSATHASFIAQLCTVLVPCLQALQGTRVGSNVWAACLLAFAGCALVLSDAADATDAALHSASLYGDVICLVSALCFAMYAVRLEGFTKQADSASLTLWSKATQAVCGIVCLFMAAHFNPGPGGPLDFLTAGTPAEMGCFATFVLFNGVVSRGYVSLWQADAFKVVSPSKAEVVFASTPLWSLLAAVVFLSEPLGPRLLAGVALFLAALGLAMAPEPEQENAAGSEAPLALAEERG